MIIPNCLRQTAKVWPMTKALVKDSIWQEQPSVSTLTCQCCGRSFLVEDDGCATLDIYCKYCWINSKYNRARCLAREAQNYHRKPERPVVPLPRLSMADLAAPFSPPSPLNGLPNRRKVALIGPLADAINAPVDNPDWDIWGLNDCAVYTRDSAGRFRADAWWELHPADDRLWARRPTGYREWLQQLPCPLLAFDQRLIPLSLVLLTDEALSGGRQFFTCTTAYQIQRAIALGYQTIGVWGMSFRSKREIIAERDCVSYWLGVAEGRGVEVITGERLLYYPYRYGLDDEHERPYRETLVQAYWPKP